ncbi:MAG: LysE family translocator [bacterium]|nr:LysE family translocator [bacterium]
MTLAALAAEGAVFGLSGGLAPGPTTALVIAQSLRYGAREGCKVAIAPLLTDLPIVLASIWLVVQLSRVQSALGCVSIAGAIFLALLGWSGLRSAPREIETAAARPYSILKGVLANGLNPHPWVFWITIGAPTVLDAAPQGAVHIAAFCVPLYLLLVGAKIALALVTSRGRGWLHTRAYVVVMRLLGLALFAYSAVFLLDGLQRLGLF